MSEKTDVYAEVTDRMIAALEAGTVPWHKPWTSAGRPRSMSTGRVYQGINTWLLGMTAQERGYSSPWWGTFRQIQELGGQVRKGQNRENGTGATKITLWKSFVPKDAEPDPVTGKVAEVVYARMIPVFCADQCEGLPERYCPEPGTEPEPIATAQNVIDAYIGSANAASLDHDVHGEAYYNPQRDEIHLPPLAEHRSPEDYYSTAFHEIVHSTGAASRLNRLDDKAAVGSHSYGKEELAAQMGASMLCAETGTDTDAIFTNSAAYIGSWLETIKGDPKMVIGAAAAGQKAADLVMEPSRQAEAAADPQPSAVRQAVAVANFEAA